MSQLPILKTPAFALVVLTLLFGALTGFAAYVDHNNPSCCVEIFPQIHVLDSEHPQYEFGVIVLIFVIAFALAFYAWRRFSINNYELVGDRAVPVSMLLYLVVTIGSLLGLAISNHSDILRIYGIFTPLLLLVGAFTYTRWVKMDYHWNRWPLRQMKKYEALLKQQSEEKARIRQLQIDSGEVVRSSTVTRDGVDGVTDKIGGELKAQFAALKGERTDKGYLWVLPALATFFTGQHERDDYVLAGCVGAMVAIVVLMGGSLAPFFVRSL